MPFAGLLFRRVVLMSGSALSPWAQASAPLNTSRKLASNLGCPAAPPHQAVDCLRKIPLQTLLKQSHALETG